LRLGEAGLWHFLECHKRVSLAALQTHFTLGYATNMRAPAIFALLAVPVFGCECEKLTECDVLHSLVIFVGEVISGGVTSLRDDPWYYRHPKPVRFKVVEIFKGLPKETKIVEMNVGPTDGMCSPNPYFPGRTYLVVPSFDNDKLFDGHCFSGRDIREAADMVQYLRDYFAGKLQLNIHGQVAVAHEWDLVEYERRIGEAKPLSGVRVWTSKGGRTYSTMTDREGRYRLMVPSGGSYDVNATLSAYESDQGKVTVEGEGCTVRDFALHSGSTISGLVLDKKGRALSHAEVGLIDLSRPGTGPRLDPTQGPELNAWLKKTYIEEDRRFVFRNVPIGKYLLVFNPAGPRAEWPSDLPLESTYYPHGTSRREAQTIEVTRTNVHLTAKNLIIGKPVKFRPVEVSVRFPDGARMKTAVVHAEEEPIEEGGVPWTFAEAVSTPGPGGKDGVFRFNVPANRKLRIYISDWHGRDLKKKYESTYTAGTAAIQQVFVIVP